MQNDRQWCKIKVRKFPFNIIWRFGVMDENPRGGGGGRIPSPGPDRVKVTINHGLSFAHKMTLRRLDYVGQIFLRYHV